MVSRARELHLEIWKEIRDAKQKLDEIGFKMTELWKLADETLCTRDEITQVCDPERPCKLHNCDKEHCLCTDRYRELDGVAATIKRIDEVKKDEHKRAS